MSAADSDPLAELTKIVQGRPSPAGSAAAARAQAPARAPANGVGLDLETELLNDLQASFAAVREALPPAAPALTRQQQPAPQPFVVEAPPQPAVTVTFAPPIERSAPLPPPAPPPPRADAPPRNDAPSELRAEFRPEPLDEARLVPIPAPPVIQPLMQVSAAPPARPIVERPAMERKPEPAAAKPSEPVAERVARPGRQPPPASEPRNDLGAFQLRGSAGAPPPPVRQPHSRWERPEPARPQPAGNSRFAPPRTAVPAPTQEDAELDPFADGGLFAQELDTGDAEDEFPLDGLPTAQDYDADEEHLPPLEDDLAGIGRRRAPNRGLIIVAGVAAVALIGGAAVWMFNPGSSGTTTAPVIAADGAPTKITPTDTAANDPDAPNKLIYDRVNSGEANSDTTLLAPDDGTTAPTADGATANPTSRVIIPGGPGIDAPPTNGSTQTAQEPAVASPPAADTPATDDAIGAVAANDAGDAIDDSISPIGPRKVRTVIVKPDGTIVSSNATDAADAGTAAAPAATAPAATDTAPVPVPTPPPVTDDVAAIAGNNGAALPITTQPDTTTTKPTTDAAPADTQTPPVAVEPPAKPAATAKPTKPVATAQNDASPIDITPGTKPEAAAGGVLVQISSQRTEDAARATYRDLQARYPNILGSYDVNIQRADVPDRGTFYRVRVGPFSQNDAQRLCDDLRSAGGDCVLAKR